MGAGPIGLFAAAIGKYMGGDIFLKNFLSLATKTMIVDISEARLKIAKEMGIEVVINSKDMSIDQIREKILSETNNNGIGNIVECSGAPILVNNSFSFLRKGGSIVMIGLPKAPLHVENVLNDIIFRAITIKTVHGRKIFHTWEECERILSEGKINLDPVISHIFPLSEYEKAFQVLLSGEACKILMEVQK